MKNKHKVEVGDWIRFYNPQRVLCIGVVSYIDKQEFPYETSYMTDIQAVKEGDVLEVRKASL